jgi:hypothetical protein
MAREVFIDTSGFYACLVKGDDRHQEAAAFLSKSARTKRGFVTTDYVLDEAATLLKARGHRHLSDKLFDRIYRSISCRVEWMDPQRFDETRHFFAKHADQKYSFTDCFSFCVMKDLRLKEALTKDDHFRTAGFQPLLA